MKFPDQLSDLYKYMQAELVRAGIQTASQDARMIIQKHTGYEWADIIASPDIKIKKEALIEIEKDILRRINGEPVSRILGEREFWGLKFKINEETLDPRPDTEMLVEIALRSCVGKQPQTILDLGTGSGCILIALLKEFPDAIGVGIDKSLSALKIARYNAKYNEVEERSSFFCGFWGQALNKKFDLIVSNPPYISNQIIPTLPKEVRNYDPILALEGGNDGLKAYRDILKEINAYIKQGGIALFEIGYDQQKDVMRLAEESGFSVRDVHHDFAGQARVVDISCGDK